MNYEDMLDRAIEDIDYSTKSSAGRFNPPAPDCEYDSNFTIFNNLKRTAKYVNRDPDELFTFIKNELATNGSLNQESGRFKGEFSSQDLTEVVDKFVNKFVLCEECNSPDTVYETVNRINMIKCTACGASRPKPME